MPRPKNNNQTPTSYATLRDEATFPDIRPVCGSAARRRPDLVRRGVDAPPHARLREAGPGADPRARTGGREARRAVDRRRGQLRAPPDKGADHRDARKGPQRGIQRLCRRREARAGRRALRERLPARVHPSERHVDSRPRVRLPAILHRRGAPARHARHRLDDDHDHGAARLADRPGLYRSGLGRQVLRRVPPDRAARHPGEHRVGRLRLPEPRSAGGARLRHAHGRGDRHEIRIRRLPSTTAATATSTATSRRLRARRSRPMPT